LRARGEGVVLSPRVSLHCHESQLGQGDLERYDSVDLKIRKEHRKATKSKSYSGLKVANGSSNNILSILLRFYKARLPSFREENTNARADTTQGQKPPLIPFFLLPGWVDKGRYTKSVRTLKKKHEKISSCPRRVCMHSSLRECEPSLSQQVTLHYCAFLCSAFWIPLRVARLFASWKYDSSPFRLV